MRHPGAAPANALGLGAFFDAVAGEVIATAAASLTPHIFIVRRPPEVDRSRIDLIAADAVVIALLTLPSFDLMTCRTTRSSSMTEGCCCACPPRSLSSYATIALSSLSSSSALGRGSHTKACNSFTSSARAGRARCSHIAGQRSSTPSLTKLKPSLYQQHSLPGFAPCESRNVRSLFDVAVCFLVVAAPVVHNGLWTSHAEALKPCRQGIQGKFERRTILILSQNHRQLIVVHRPCRTFQKHCVYGGFSGFLRHPRLRVLLQSTSGPKWSESGPKWTSPQFG